MISWESIVSEKSEANRAAEAARLACRMDAVQYAAGRYRSSGAVRKKLLEKGHSCELIAEIMPGLAHDGYLHDDALAASLARERRGRKAESQQALAQRMRRLGIKEDSIYEALASAESDFTLVGEFLSQQAAHLIDVWLHDVDNYVDSQKALAAIMRKAASRGFGSQITLDWLRRNYP